MKFINGLKIMNYNFYTVPNKDEIKVILEQSTIKIKSTYCKVNCLLIVDYIIILKDGTVLKDWKGVNCKLPFPTNEMISYYRQFLHQPEKTIRLYLHKKLLNEN